MHMNDYSQQFTQTHTSTGYITIDMITMLFKVKFSNRKLIQKHLSRMVKNDLLKQTKSPEYKSNDTGSSDIYKERYIANIANPDGTTGTLTIEANPKKNTRGNPRAYLRFEYNPNKCDSTIVAKYIKRILGSKMYKSFHSRCWITRIDITSDVIGITPDDILIYVPGLRKSEMIRGKDYQIETIYTGSRSSRLFFNTYNKERELETNLNIELGYYITRFEVTVRNRGKQIKIRDLPGIENVFALINVYDSDIDESLFPKAFIANLKENGLQKALMSMTRSRRPGILNKLEQYRTSPLQPEKLWESFTKALSFLDTFKYHE